MRKIIIVSILLLLNSCSLSSNFNNENTTFERNKNCAEIALQYEKVFKDEYNYKEWNIYSSRVITDYFYSKYKNTCIWVFEATSNMNPEEKIKTKYFFIDLLTNEDLSSADTEAWKSYIIEDYKSKK